MPNGEEKRMCIGGSSIQRFTGGFFMCLSLFRSFCQRPNRLGVRLTCPILFHKGSVTQGNFWYISGAGRTRHWTFLPHQLKSRFSNTQMTCVEYDCLTKDQIREMLRRLQLSVTLTPAERLPAITGHRLPCFATCTMCSLLLKGSKGASLGVKLVDARFCYVTEKESSHVL
ncbi:hypothetical protein IW261DRAFT_894939 [Armillaria novae-zelandiae]|uniref:Uncharacterized protein n=1 Tax=Armillaria novae-zelandiae TaxID=153914 RepID=A0AA39NTC9_9AGAR|nr:hypothetical protein IW261DRAFT_894939 [Armillaria novae-zelandiae]